MADANQSVPERAALVREFYRAVSEQDAAALRKLVETSFARDAAVVLPDSLPYGGTVTGASRLARMFGQMASSPVPVGPVGPVVTAVVNGGDLIGAQIEFDWHNPGAPRPLRTGALELWAFDDDGLVREIRAYYWDTAACAALAQSADS